MAVMGRRHVDVVRSLPHGLATNAAPKLAGMWNVKLYGSRFEEKLIIFLNIM